MSDEVTSSSGAEAQALLNRLSQAIAQPDVKRILDTLEEAEQTCLQQVVDFRLEGAHDLANHFSLIGEIRGLRRFKFEVAQVVSDCTEIIQESEQKAREQNIS